MTKNDRCFCLRHTLGLFIPSGTDTPYSNKGLAGLCILQGVWTVSRTTRDAIHPGTAQRMTWGTSHSVSLVPYVQLVCHWGKDGEVHPRVQDKN